VFVGIFGERPDGVEHCVNGDLPSGQRGVVGCASATIVGVHER